MPIFLSTRAEAGFGPRGLRFDPASVRNLAQRDRVLCSQQPQAKQAGSGHPPVRRDSRHQSRHLIAAARRADT